jgi:glutamate synthase (ferredoxin)
MSGGIAYIYDVKKTFYNNCNKEGLNIDPVEDYEDRKALKQLIENHFNATMSPLAQRLLEKWDVEVLNFIKVLPEEYRQALIRLNSENNVTV